MIQSVSHGNQSDTYGAESVKYTGVLKLAAATSNISKSTKTAKVRQGEVCDAVIYPIKSNATLKSPIVTKHRQVRTS